MIQVFLLYAFFGLTFTLGKVTLFYAKPFFIIATRMLIGGSSLIAYTIIKHRISLKQIFKQWHLYIQVALFGIFIPYGLRAWALQYVSSTKAAFIFTLMPFFTALFSYALNSDILSRQKIWGLLTGFIGMVPTLLTQTRTETQHYELFGFISIPELALLGSVASFGYNLIALQKLIKHHSCPPLIVNGLSMLMAGLISLSFSCVTEPIWLTGNGTRFGILLGLQILISNLVCSNLQANLLKNYSPTFMAFASFLSPLCAAFYGWFFLHEQISWHFFVSFFVVLTGLAIYYFDEIVQTKKSISN